MHAISQVGDIKDLFSVEANPVESTVGGDLLGFGAEAERAWCASAQACGCYSPRNACTEVETIYAAGGTRTQRFVSGHAFSKGCG